MRGCFNQAANVANSDIADRCAADAARDGRGGGKA